MKLIGMLDSPYVRRAVISLRMLGLTFEHQSLSVFRTYTEFQRINPRSQGTNTGLRRRYVPHGLDADH